VKKASCADSDEWLQAHNNYRALHGVPAVTWDDTLAAQAQSWADTCPSGHSTQGSIYRPYGVGENIAGLYGFLDIAQVVKGWYDEEQYYDYSNPGTSLDPTKQIDSFTRVVWKNTAEIGCGCKSGCGLWHSVCVCQYSPAGNVPGQYGANVFPPLSLGEALDNTSLTWTTGGNANWFKQTTTSYYDGDAAESGDIDGSQSSWIQTMVTGPINVEFYWKVSSEKNGDFLVFYIEDVPQDGRISGDVDWTKKVYSIPSGSYEISWRYEKDWLFSDGSDKGWLDKVTLTTGGTGTGKTPVWLFPLLLD